MVNMIKKLYPGGKAKAFNITYDDGVQQDIRFVEMLNKYGIKGTFNLNSGLMKEEFEWTHESGLVVKRLPEKVVVDLYQNHEVASHTLSHPYMYNLTEAEIMNELVTDKTNLQRLFGRTVFGFAVPFDYYSDLIEKCVMNSGFEYARISEESYSYIPGTDYYRWKAGIFHLNSDLEAFVEEFLKTDEELALCQIVGHSYDLDTECMWDRIEAILKKVSEDTDVVPVTTIELVRYLKAMRNATVEEFAIKNNSDIDLWFNVDGEIKVLCPGESYLK